MDIHDITDEITEIQCQGCEGIIDRDVDPAYETDSGGDLVCHECWNSAMENASRAYLVGPAIAVSPETGTVPPVYVTEFGNVDMWGAQIDAPLARSYHSTDGWRGHYETRVTEEDWTTVSSGWTTGDWGDITSDSKQDFNDWAQDLISGETVSDIPVWIILDPTSNVFSTSVSVWVPRDQAHSVRVPKGL